jgi:hypothetical protein
MLDLRPGRPLLTNQAAVGRISVIRKRNNKALVGANDPEVDNRIWISILDQAIDLPASNCTCAGSPRSSPAAAAHCGRGFELGKVRRGIDDRGV